jgi:hypothetical protein
MESPFDRKSHQFARQHHLKEPLLIHPRQTLQTLFHKGKIQLHEEEERLGQ